MSKSTNFEVFKIIWDKSPIIVLDANILLDLYRYSADATEDIINVLSNVNEQLWIPFQVKVEFNKNKDLIKKQQFNKYKNIPKEINSIIKTTLDSIGSKFFRYKQFHFPNIDILEHNIINNLNALSQQVSSFNDGINEEEIRNKNLLRNNIVEEFVEKIISTGNIGREYNILDLIKIYQEGEIRYKYLIPPGYMDAREKDDLTKFGDLIVWKQILEYAKFNNKEILFVTRDTKEDWWETSQENGQKVIVGPRNELIEEFDIFVQFNKHFNMITLNELIPNLSKMLNINTINTQLELDALDYIKVVFDGKVDGDFEREFQKYIDTIDPYQIIDNSSRDINVIKLIDASVPNITDVFVEFKENEVIYNVEFKIHIKFNGFVNFDDERDDIYDIGIGIGTTQFRGNFSLSRNIDYENDDLEDLDTDYENFLIDNIEVIESQFIEKDDLCIMCQEREGEYNYNDEGLICDYCYSHNDVATCTSCGRVLPWSNMGGDGFCKRCSPEYDY
ncbi:PIN-like domain-containing protein [Clostridium sp.]|uniref:PIN-like domain-containing protein n=1 Tax=Clostridium sp. TaxID=1506 RepID=UPI0026017116|nr:PIN domain-containing protein [uncultured Clostridium sp.]